MTSIIVSVVWLKAAIASLMATKVRLPNVNWAAELAPKLAVVSLAVMPVLSRVAIAPKFVKPDRAVVTRNKSLPGVALKSVITSNFASSESLRIL